MGIFLLYDTIQRQGVKLIAPNQRSAQHSSITVSGVLHPLPRLSEGPLLLYTSINTLSLSFCINYSDPLDAQALISIPRAMLLSRLSPLSSLLIGPSAITGVVNYSGLVRRRAHPDAKLASWSPSISVLKYSCQQPLQAQRLQSHSRFCHTTAGGTLLKLRLDKRAPIRTL